MNHAKTIDDFLDMSEEDLSKYDAGSLRKIRTTVITRIEIEQKWLDQNRHSASDTVAKKVYDMLDKCEGKMALIESVIRGKI